MGVFYRLQFNGRRGKAFAFLTAVMDEDMTMQMPTLAVTLVDSDSYLKSEVVDFSQIEHHIDQAFAVFAAIKRAVGISRRPGAHTVTIGASTELTRRYTGVGGRDAVKFGMEIPEGNRGCHRSLESALGKRWDILPGAGEEDLDLAVKSLRFTEHRDFGVFLIRCVVSTTEGRYQHEDDYRALLRYNWKESAKVDYVEEEE